MKHCITYLLLLVITPVFAAHVTVTKTTADLASLYSWTSGSFYGSFQLDAVVSVAANQPTSGNINGYYSPDTPRDWRLYQARNNGEFTISVKDGYKLQSICLTYATAKSGVLCVSPGTSVAEADRVVSDQVYMADTNAVTFYVGNTAGGSTGQVKVIAFRVVYCDSTTLVESFSQVVQTKSNSVEAVWNGDYADWDVLYARRGAKDTLNGRVQATWTCKGTYLRSAVTEGGVKHLHFDWREFGAPAEADLRLAMAIGDWQDTASFQAEGVFATSKNRTYDAEVGCKENAQILFSNISPVSDNYADRFLLGDFFITPYIYFAANSRFVQVEQSIGSLDLRPYLMDNTEGEGTIVYTIVSDSTEGTTVSGSVLDFTGAACSGGVVVEASWNEGKVTTTMTVGVNVVAETGIEWTETFSRCPYAEVKGMSYLVGDEQVYDWNLSNFTRKASDTIGTQQAIHLLHEGIIATNGAQEGGLKSFAFDWLPAESTQAIEFKVKVNGSTKTYKYQAGQFICSIAHFQRACNVKSNTAFSIQIGTAQSPAQSTLLIGDIRITPYLLFAKRYDTLRVADSTYYDLAPLLIDNTGSENVEWTIIQDKSQKAVLFNGLINVTDVPSNETVTVQAAWGDVTTTFNLWVEVNDPSGIDTPSSVHPASYTKTIRDGHLLIRRGAALYSVLGQPF